MLINVLLVLVVAAMAGFFGWLTRRASLVGNPFIKWIGIILAGLLTLIVGLVAVVAAIGLVKYYTPPSHPVQELKVEGTPEQIARGQHLAAAFCAGCHSTTADFPLTGGVDMGADLPMPLGQYVSVNLTPAGPLKDWTDGEIFRAIRDNVDKDGNRLVFMTNTNVRRISDDDVHAIIAFLRSQQPVEHATLTPPDHPTLLAFILTGAGIIPTPPPVEGPIVAPPIAPTAEYGKFMVRFLDCTNCHGADLSGGTSSFAPNGPSLRVVKSWTAEQFIATLRTGRDPDGQELKPPMPWKPTGRLDDVELTALYEYLVSLP